jgi:hypothetical protein
MMLTTEGRCCFPNAIKKDIKILETFIENRCYANIKKRKNNNTDIYMHAHNEIYADVINISLGA